MSKSWLADNDEILLSTKFDYKGKKTCDAVAFISTGFRRLQETSRFLRSPRGLNLKAFDFVAADRLAKHYLRGGKAVVKTLELAVNEHNAKLVVVVHNAELILPNRFKSRKEEEEFHEDRMLTFAREVMLEHTDVRVLPIYVRIANSGNMLEYVSFEGLIDGSFGKKVIWTATFSLKDVVSCEFLVQMCLDFRFRLETFDLARSHFKFPYYHLLGMAGSCYGLVNGDEIALKSVERVIRMGASKGLVVNHQGCAAYKKHVYGMKPAEEQRFHRDQLHKNAAILKKMGLKEVFSVYIQLIKNDEWMRFVAVR